jgi:hypothetical protein
VLTGVYDAVDICVPVSVITGVFVGISGVPVPVSVGLLSGVFVRVGVTIGVNDRVPVQVEVGLAVRVEEPVGVKVYVTVAV